MKLNHALFSVALLMASLGDVALAAGRFYIGPYASVSSSKSIKPKGDKQANTSDEVVTQRTTYGLKLEARLSRLFSLTATAGTNKTDTTKKAIVTRDEFGEIDLQKDANVDPSRQDARYRLQEEQRLGTAGLQINPTFGGMLTVKAGVGVRARQRFLTVTEEGQKTKEEIEDKIRWHAVGTAGLQVRLLRAFSMGAEYKFYFIKFPKLEPHEQEVAISFGVSI